MRLLMITHHAELTSTLTSCFLFILICTDLCNIPFPPDMTSYNVDVTESTSLKIAT